MARKKKFAPNDNNLAIAYYRFSSHSQNDASIDQQRELAHDWADAHGFKIVQEYEDAAISGTTDARPGFQQMLSEVAKIRPHTLIMWKTDRLCSATIFLRNSDRIFEKNSPVLRSKSETRSLASTAPKMEGAAHVKGRVLAWGGAAFAAPPLAFCPWGSSYPSVASPASSAASCAATGSVYSDQP